MNMTEKSGRPVGRSPGWEGEYQGASFQEEEPGIFKTTFW